MWAIDLSGRSTEGQTDALESEGRRWALGAARGPHGSLGRGASGVHRVYQEGVDVLILSFKYHT